MTTEDSVHTELLARFARLEAHLQLLNAEFREVKVLLGSAQFTPSISSGPALAPSPVAVNRQVAPVTQPSAAAGPVIPTTETSMLDDWRLLKSSKRGWLMARIEQLVEESGPTFSYHTIFDAYRAKWGWKSYPSEGTIGMTLWKVVRKHGHRVVSAGGGRRSTVYEKVRQV